MDSTGRFSFIEEFVRGGQIISGEKFLNSSKSYGKFHYLKRDYLYKSGCWRGDQVESLLKRGRFFGEKTLVLGHSDIPTRIVDSLFIRSIGITKVFATNSREFGGFSHSLPLGITNDCDDSPLHRILGNESHFLAANSTAFNQGGFDSTIYVNFTSKNNSAVRGAMLDVLKNISHLYKIAHETPDFSDVGRIRYLSSLRKHNLVICPEGNGVDTHRFWETIYMGGTPVVIRNPKMEFFYDRLPVLQLTNWTELIDISHIESKWWELAGRVYGFEEVSIDYWLRRLLGTLEIE